MAAKHVLMKMHNRGANRLLSVRIVGVGNNIRLDVREQAVRDS